MATTYKISSTMTHIVALMGEGLRYQEIADRLNVSVRTVQSCLYEGKKTLMIGTTFKLCAELRAYIDRGEVRVPIPTEAPPQEEQEDKKPSYLPPPPPPRFAAAECAICPATEGLSAMLLTGSSVPIRICEACKTRLKSVRLQAYARAEENVAEGAIREERALQKRRITRNKNRQQES